MLLAESVVSDTEMGQGVTRTIRFDKELDEALQTIGRHEKMSVNAIVNKLVREYVEWDRYNEKIHIMEISPSVLSEPSKQALSTFPLLQAVITPEKFCRLVIPQGL